MLTPLPPPPQLTFVDFVAYDVLEQLQMFAPDCPELQGNLAQFLQRFEVSGGPKIPVPISVPDPVPILSSSILAPVFK